MVNRLVLAALLALAAVLPSSAQTTNLSTTGAIDKAAVINAQADFRIGPDGAYWVYSRNSVRKLSANLDSVLLSIPFGDADTSVSRVEALPDGSIYILAQTTSATLLVSPTAPYPIAQGSPSFYLARYDAQGKSQTYGTYLPGSVYGTAIGKDGSIYLDGYTFDPNFRVTSGPGVHQNCTSAGSVSSCNSDGFILKLDPKGQLAYSLVVGGSGSDQAFAIAVDAQGNAYVGGSTSSTDLSVGASAYQTHLRGQSDMFVGKVRSDGSGLEWLTYLGGDNDYPFAPNDGCHDGFEEPESIALGADGSVYLAGETTANDFPTSAGAVQPHMAGGIIGHTCTNTMEAVVARLSGDGQNLLFGTYLGGGASVESALSLAVDARGSATVVGQTGSPDFPLASPLQASFSRQYADCVFGCPDGYIARLSQNGTTLEWSTFMGGLDFASVYRAAFDANGQLVVAASGLTLATSGALNEASGSTSILRIDAAPDLPLSSSAEQAAVFSRPYTVQFTLKNKNTAEASSELTLTPPPSMDFQTATASPSQGSCALQGNGTYVCSLGAVAPQATASVQLSGTALKCADLTFQGSAQYQLNGKTEYIPDNFLFRSAVPHSSLGVGIPSGPFPPSATINTNYVKRLVVTNGGPETAPGVVLKAVFPNTFSFISATPSQGSCDAAGSCSLGDIPAKTSVNVDYTLKFPHPGSYFFTTEYQKADSDCPPPFPPSPQQNYVNVTSNADLGIQIVESPTTTPLTPGQHAVWKIRISNSGPDEALAEVFSPQTYTTTLTIGGKQLYINSSNTTLIPAGQSIDATVDVLVPGLTSNQFEQDVIVTGSNDPNQANNTVALKAALNNSANLKTSASGVSAQSDTVAFTANFMNNGLADAKNVRWTVTLPAGESVISFQAGSIQNSCGVTPTGMQCTVADLAPANQNFKGFDVAITTSLHEISKYAAVLNAVSDSPEADASDNTFTVSLAGDYGFLIDAGTQQLTLHNGQATLPVAALFGPKTANDLVLSLSCDKLPAGMTCSFSPASVTKSSPQSTLTISMPVQQAALTSAKTFPFWAMAIVPVGLLLGSSQKFRTRAALLIVIVSFCVLLGCGTAGSQSSASPQPAAATPQTPPATPPPAGSPTPTPTPTATPIGASFTIQIVASAGTQRATIPLTVQVQ